MNNFKNFYSKLLKIGKKLYKNIDIYYIGNITVIDLDYDVTIHYVNRLCFIISKADGYIETKKHCQNTQKFGIKLRI